MHILKRWCGGAKIKKKAHTSWQPQEMQSKWQTSTSVSLCSAELFQGQFASLPVNSIYKQRSEKEYKTSKLLVISSGDFFYNICIISNLWICNDYAWFLAVMCCSCMAFWGFLLFYLSILQHILGQ